MNKNKRGFSSVGLYYPQKQCNVGSVLRACGCYGASMLAIQGNKYTKDCTDTQARYKHMPLLHTTSLKDTIPYAAIPVAVEIIEGAIPLQNYTHTESAFYIFGPESSSLGKQVTDWCRDIIYVPTEYCMNLAATVNVVLYDRMAKQNNMIKKLS